MNEECHHSPDPRSRATLAARRAPPHHIEFGSTKRHFVIELGDLCWMGSRHIILNPVGVPNGRLMKRHVVAIATIRQHLDLGRHLTNINIPKEELHGFCSVGDKNVGGNAP